MPPASVTPASSGRGRSARRSWSITALLLLLALLWWQLAAEGMNGAAGSPGLDRSFVESRDAVATSSSALGAAARPRVTLRIRQRQVSTEQRARVRVAVRLGRSASQVQVRSLRSGRVKVRVTGPGTTRVVRARLVDRRAIIRLPRLPAGSFQVRAVFLGTRLLDRARSRSRTLTVVRPGSTTAPDGWPGTGNTGVPAGTTLTPYNGSCTITSPVTIDAKTLDCPGSVQVRAAGVVIKNSMINGRIVVDTDVNRSWSLVLTDSEVDAGDGDLPAIYNGNVTIERTNIHGGHNGLECQEHSSHCVLRDSWIHDQWQLPTGDQHLGGFLALGVQVPCTGTDGACVELVHNTIVCDAPVNVDDGGCTGDINLLPHFGPLPSALIENNFLGANATAAACTFGGAGQEYPGTNIVYRDNVFQRGSNRACAAYGPVAFFDHTAQGNVWVNNRYDDGVAILCDARHSCG